MVQFTPAQQSVMNHHLDTFEGKINITQMVRDIGLPTAAWVSVNNYVKEYLANPPQIDGIPQQVMAHLVGTKGTNEFANVIDGEPFPMASGTLNLDSVDEQFAKQEIYYSNRLEETTQARNAIRLIKKALRT